MARRKCHPRRLRLQLVRISLAKSIFHKFRSRSFYRFLVEIKVTFLVFKANDLSSGLRVCASVNSLFMKDHCTVSVLKKILKVRFLSFWFNLLETVYLFILIAAVRGLLIILARPVEQEPNSFCLLAFHPLRNFSQKRETCLGPMNSKK